MQKHYYRDLDGTLVDMGAYAPRLNWIGQLKAEEGTYGSWTVTLDDPAGELDILGHRQWFVEDDESEDEDDIIFGGFTGSQTFSRMDADQRRPIGPESRVVTVELMDANTWLSKIIMRGSDANRTSIETDAERMDWLLATDEATLILDSSTFVNASGPRNMDEADLRGTYVGQIIADCAGTSGKNHYIWYRKVSGTRTLTIWYGRDTLTTYPSPFYLTNDRADIDQFAVESGTAVVWPLSDDAKMKRSPEKQYCGNYATYGDRGAATYVHNADTHALIASYGSGHRDMTSNFPLIRKKATARARAARQLLDVQDQEIRVTTTIRNIPSTRVTLAKAGMRLQVKGTHWGPSLDDWHYARIVSAQPRPHSKGDLYDIDLELSIPNGDATSPGPPADDFTGEVFAGLQRSSPNDPGNVGGDKPLCYLGAYSAPLSGWDAQPITGPIAVDQGAAPFFSITVSAPMTVRIEAAASYSEVYLPAVTIALNVYVNGVLIATDSQSSGSGFQNGRRHVDVRGYHLDAGDTVSIDGSIAKGWANFGINNTYLKVGRGSPSGVNEDDGSDWVGP